jgi:CRISPR-associated protein Cas6
MRSATMVDVAFALGGDALPPAHRAALADAVEAVLPWLRDMPAAGLRLSATAASDGRLLLSGRTRLVLRVPRDRAGESVALEGAALALDDARLHVGPGRARELLPFGTLYAPLVAAAAGDDEAAFLRAVSAALGAIGVAGRAICGRRQSAEGGALQGYGLMVDQLDAEDSLRLLEAGLGPERRLGCGLFVPHRSAAAVGAAPY